MTEQNQGAQAPDDNKQGQPAGDPNPAENAGKSDDGKADKGFSLLSDQDNADLIEIKAGEKPEGLDEKFWDKEKKQIKTDELTQDYIKSQNRIKGLRDKLAKGAQNAPDAPEKYAVTFDDLEEEDKKVLSESMADKPENLLLQEFKKAAHDSKLSQEQFLKMSRHMSKFIHGATQQHLQQQNKEWTAEEKQAYADQEYQKLGKNAPQIVRATSEFVARMRANGHFSEADVEFAKNVIATDAQGIGFLNRLRTAYGGDSIPTDNSAISDGLPSDREIGEMFASREYKESDTFRKKVDDLLTKRREAGRPEMLQI